MSLSPLVSFKSRFVTYLLNFPRKNDISIIHLQLPSSYCSEKSTIHIQDGITKTNAATSKSKTTVRITDN